MKSENKNKSGFTAMLKNVFRRNILGLILTQLFTFLITIFFITNSLTRKPESVFDLTFEYSGAVSTVLSIISIIVSLVVAYSLYRELFSRRASDFLLSMPVKREAYYNANFLFGIINIALSYLISFAVSVFCIKSNTIYPAKFYIFDVSSFASLMLISFLAVAAIYATFVVCAAISGRIWHYFILSYFAVSGTYSAAMGLLSYIDSIWGYTLEYDYSFIVSPFSTVMISTKDKLSHFAIMIIALAAQFVVSYAVGFIAFKHRKAEVAETTVFGKILPLLIITVFLLSSAFSFIMITRNLYINLVITLIGMTVLVLIITALFYRKPFNKLTITSLAVSVAITAVTVCCVQFIPKASGYIDYVPEVSEVESVTVKCGEDYKDMNSIGIVEELMLSAFDIDGEDSYIYNLSSDEAKTAVSALHKKMASEEAIDRYYDVDTYVYDAVNGIRLEYKLKNGRTVVRTYSVNASIASKEFAAVLKTDECLDQIAPMNYIDDILFVTADFYEYDEEYLESYNEEDYNGDSIDEYEYIQLDDYKPLLDCVKKDMKKDVDEYNLLTSNGFDPEYYSEFNEEEDYYDEDEYTVGRLSFYKFSESATEEDKEKLSKMKPEEILSYDINQAYESDYESPYILENVDFLVMETDDNTIKYLERLGYKH